METNPIKAIKEKCLDCCAYQREEVKLCTCTDCPLYPFRMGKNPFRKKKELTDAQKENAAERLKNAREARLAK